MNKPNTTRRSFLKASLAAGTAAVISGTKGRAKIIGANDRVRIAVAGLNGRGGSHIGGFMGQKNVEIAYLVDPDSRAVARRIDEVNRKGQYKPKGAADIRHAIADKDVDAITVAAPNHWHSLMTIWGAQGGKHVYVEKPMSHDVHEGRVAVEAQKKYGVVIQHGTQRRSSAKIAGLHEMINAGKFGKLKISYGYCCKPRGGIGFKSPGVSPNNLDWNLWRGPAVIDTFHANYVHYNWHGFWETGNGDLNNQGTPARRCPLGNGSQADQPDPRHGDRRPLPVERSGRNPEHHVRHRRVPQRAVPLFQRPKRQLRRLPTPSGD